MTWLHKLRARFQLLRSRRDSDARFDDELRFHLEMEAERLARDEGLGAAEAWRQARIRFGGIEGHREAMRDERGLRWLGGLSLDFRLGLRMMARWPGLTLVGVIGIAVAVAVGTFAYGMIDTLVGPPVPIDEGRRVVMIENWDARSSRERGETHLHDLQTWRTSLTALDEIAAYRIVQRNLVVSGAAPEPVQVAEVTASAFTIARVAPLMGRFLLPEDEGAGATPVVVIAYDTWQRRLGGAPDVLQRTLQLGGIHHQVVGVMPHGFLFPVHNRIWTPLRLDPLRFPSGAAPPIKVFGRLADGTSIADVRQQAMAASLRLAPARGDAADAVRTQVMEYGRAFAEDPSLAWALQLIKVAVSLLLVIIGINVATLVFARTGSRSGEIAVRTALGASRARIVGQLFVEGLVLTAIATAIGFGAALFALRYLGTNAQRLAGDALPYWFDFRVSTGMLLYVVALALLSAFLIGALPALKATGHNVRQNLQTLGGGGGMRLGRSWTVLIVAQVAVAVALLPVVVHVAVVKPGMDRVPVRAYDTRGWLTMHAHLDRGDVPEADSVAALRYADTIGSLAQALRANSEVVDVVVMSHAPGSEGGMYVEADTSGLAPGSLPVDRRAGHHYVGHASVEERFFEALGIPILAGRALRAGDGAAPTIVVNQPFVEKVFGRIDPLGRRIRVPSSPPNTNVTSAGPGPWLEIVGVVPDFPSGKGRRTAHPMLYRLLDPMAARPLVIAARLRSTTPLAGTGTLRETAMGIDPQLRLEQVRLLDDASSVEAVLDRVLLTGVLLVTLSVVLLSAAGIYALMSFTIARRRREIGIRAALGAGARQIVSGVLSRAARQVCLGIAIGLVFSALVMSSIEGKWSLYSALSLLSVAVFMTIVGVGAAWAPTRAALRIEPTEALREG